MTRLIWDSIDSRVYHTGISHGVFYPESGPGVVWNGLAEVSTILYGAKAQPYYYDGDKRTNVLEYGTFQANIKTYSVPSGFEECFGERSVVPGFILTRQTRSRFGLSYRININESDYKLHLIYNAVTSPSFSSYMTLTETANLATTSFTIDATPPSDSEHIKPSAHLIFDSRKAPSAKLEALENVLYGEITTPTLPTQSEIINAFQQP
jgi:hypothetical protein